MTKRELRETEGRLSRALESEAEDYKDSEPPKGEASLSVALDRPAGLICTDGDEQLLDHVINIFLETAGAQIQELAAFVAQGDIVGVKAEAHRLKGASGNIGASRIQALAGSIEMSVHEGQLQQLPSLAEELEQAFDELRQVVASG